MVKAQAPKLHAQREMRITLLFPSPFTSVFCIIHICISHLYFASQHKALGESGRAGHTYTHIHTHTHTLAVK